jgi:dTMP kinase
LSLDFHDRVRQGFLDLAAHEPSRYLVVDATQSPDAVESLIQVRVVELLDQA